MDLRSLRLLALAGLVGLADPAPAQEYQGKEDHLYACMRDGVRTYTTKTLPTDAACRRITYRWVERVQQAPADPPGTFMGYKCAGTCSGHRAGYAWASQQGASTASKCTGNSQSFVEGCMAYVTEKNRGQGR